MTRHYVVYSTVDGDVGERRGLRALAYTGEPLSPDDLIPLPDGASLAMLPHRLAVGQDGDGARHVVSERHGWALAALLPIGYTRTKLPAYEKTPETEPLPFFGYTAIAGWRGRLYAAALRTDDPERWVARNYRRAPPEATGARAVGGRARRTACWRTMRTARSTTNARRPATSSLAAGRARSPSRRAVTRAASAASPSRMRMTWSRRRTA